MNKSLKIKHILVTNIVVSIMIVCVFGLETPTASIALLLIGIISFASTVYNSKKETPTKNFKYFYFSLMGIIFVYTVVNFFF